LTHLNYFAERIIDGQIFPDEEVDALYQSMTKNMIKEQEIINKLAEFIKSQYHTVLTKQEEIYLLIHLHRLILGN
jgi:beta-glucoside operon transcriptional antiterminator